VISSVLHRLFNLIGVLIETFNKSCRNRLIP
jgi:hypothetical protein